MDMPENERPVQAEDVENQVSPEGADAGIAPCMLIYWNPWADSEGCPGGAIGAGDLYGSGSAWGGGMGH